MKLQDMTIGRKLGFGFTAMLVLIAIASLVGGLGIVQINARLHDVSDDHVPIMQAALGMQLALSQGLEVMEHYNGALGAGMIAVDVRELDKVGGELGGFAADFDTYSNAIVNGGEIRGQTVAATKDAALANLVRQADDVHNRKFKVAAETIISAGKQLAEARALSDQTMAAMEEAFAALVERADYAETVTQQRIEESKRRAGSVAELSSLLEREVPYIDVTMELKGVIAESRYFLEEVGQAVTAAAIDDYERQYREATARFDQVMAAGLGGGEVDNTRVIKINDERVLSALAETDRFHEQYQRAAARLIEEQRTLVAKINEVSTAKDAMDSSVVEATALLDKAVETAGKDLAAARDAAGRARSWAIGILVLAALLAVAIGLVLSLLITRSIVGPIAGIQEAAEGLALGDLDQRLIGVERRDEVGMMARSFQLMIDYLQGVARVADTIAGGDLRVTVEPRSRADALSLSMQKMAGNLRQMLAEITASSTQVASSSDEISASATQISKGAENQATSSDETSSTMVEMASQIDNVAASAQALASNVDRTSSSIQEMGTSIEQVARNAENLLSSVEETSATIEQMTSSIAAVANKVKTVDDVAREAADVAREGGGELSGLINGIGASSQNIGKIVKIIEDIADQTNLLALNAAIEAARAGEAGKGFAVVAEEVNRLAERSMKSTSEISTFVETVQQDTRQAVDMSGSILERISGAVGKASELVSEVYTSSQEQASGAGQILKTATHMQDVTRQVAAAAKQQAESAAEINRSVEAMNKMTQQVADATLEQKRGGDQVVKAIEEIASVARQNSAATDQLSVATQRLATEAERMQKLAKQFTV